MFPQSPPSISPASTQIATERSLVTWSGWPYLNSHVLRDWHCVLLPLSNGHCSSLLSLNICCHFLLLLLLLNEALAPLLLRQTASSLLVALLVWLLWLLPKESPGQRCPSRLALIQQSWHNPPSNCTCPFLFPLLRPLLLSLVACPCCLPLLLALVASAFCSSANPLLPACGHVYREIVSANYAPNTFDPRPSEGTQNGGWGCFPLVSP